MRKTAISLMIYFISASSHALGPGETISQSADINVYNSHVVGLTMTGSTQPEGFIASGTTIATGRAFSNFPSDKVALRFTPGSCTSITNYRACVLDNDIQPFSIYVLTRQFSIDPSLSDGTWMVPRPSPTQADTKLDFIAQGDQRIKAGVYTISFDATIWST